MPPVRRYLRITKFSVLECRIYLDNPADGTRWLLHPASPVLPRVLEAVRPLVLPKLREENARAKAGKGGKKKGWKDLVIEDDFEVAVFLTEISARHAILKKAKRMKSEGIPTSTSNGTWAEAGTKHSPVLVPEEAPSAIIREESQEGERIALGDIPAAAADEGEDLHEEREEGDRTQGVTQTLAGLNDSDNRIVQKGALPQISRATEDDADDKKKMTLGTTYDGFSIHNRILCLVIKRRGPMKGKGVGAGTGQALMEDWIASTQAGTGRMMDD